MVEPISPQKMKMALALGFLKEAAQGFAKVGRTIIRKATAIAHLGEEFLGGERKGLLCPWAHRPVGEANG